MDKLLIAIAVTIPFLGYILFSESFNEGSDAEVSTEIVDETDRTTSTSEQTLFVPEGHRRLDDYTIVIDVGIQAGALDAVWVIYGKEADALDSATPRMTNELGMGTAGEYGGYSMIISAAELEPGISYFYKVVGQTPEGEILYSGLNRFTAGK